MLKKIKKPKIVVRIYGGIGNQLFCYAAARRLSIINNYDLVIDNVSGFTFDTKYKRFYQLHNFSIPCRMATEGERCEPFGRLKRLIWKTASKFKNFEDRSYIKQELIEFDPRILSIKKKNLSIWMDIGKVKSILKILKAL